MNKSVPSNSIRVWMLAAVMLTLMSAELAYLFTAGPGVQKLAHMAALATVCLGIPAFRLREFYLIAMSLCLAATVIYIGVDVSDTLLNAADQASFLAAFILLMSLLREAAQSSTAVVTCGSYLTRQPPKRRYISIHAGSTFISALVNFGSISLLSPLVTEGVRDAAKRQPVPPEVSIIRERRQLLAVHRGFSWFLVWAPTAVIQAILPGILTKMHVLTFIGLGAILSVSMMIVGWLEDTFRWRNVRRKFPSMPAPADGKPPSVPIADALTVAFVCISLTVLTLSFSTLGNVNLVPALMLSSPIVLVVWLIAQNRHQPNLLQVTVHRLQKIGKVTIPSSVPETATFAASGFIGVTLAAVAPVNTIADHLDLANTPQWLVLFALPLVSALVGQFGLTPMVTVVFLASFFSHLPDLTIPHTYLAVAIASGAALAMGSSPFSSGSLLMARATGHDGLKIAWRWNSLFTALAIITLAIYFFVLTGGR